MAATNFTPIQLYFSTTASAAPLAANLAQGELAINITDGKLYYEDGSGDVQVIATKGAVTIGGSNTQIQYNNSGALAGNAAMVFDSATSIITLTTLNLTNALGAIYGGTAQSTYAQGDVLYASAANTLAKLGIGASTFILTSNGTIPQWVAPSSIAVLTATNLAGGAAGSVPYQSGVATTTFLAIGTANRVMTSSGTAPQWVTSLTGLTGVSSSSITNTSLTAGRVVISSTAGLQSDDADLTFDGTTLSSGGFSTVGLSTLVKTVKIGDSSFSGVAVFAAATPAKLYMGTGTVTDVTSAISATNTTGAIASLGITPIAATNTGVTYTNASTLYIAGAPSAGTNITITNPYALYVAAGATNLGGNTAVTGTLSASGALSTSGNLTLNGVTQAVISAVCTAGSSLLDTNLIDSGGGTPVMRFNRNSTAGTITRFCSPGTVTSVVDISSTGLAVTGTLSATGQTTLSGGALKVYGALDVGLTAAAAYDYQVATNHSRVIAYGPSVTRGTYDILCDVAGGGSAIVTGSFSGTGLAVTGTLSATGVATFSAGTVLLPAITTTGDTNTGIFFPAADTIAFAEGGAEAMRIDSSGNLGIGTSSPAVKLDVNGTARVISYGSPSTGSGVEIDYGAAGTGIGRILAYDRGGATSKDMRYDALSHTFKVGASIGTTAVTISSTGTLTLAKSQGIIQNGTDGYLALSGGSSAALGAVIFAFGESHATNPNEIQFRNSGNTTRLTLNATGSLTAIASVGVASGTYSFQDASATPGPIRSYHATDSNGTANNFLICDAAASVLRAEIRSNGGLANYSANNVNLSDVRTKTAIEPAGSYLAKICAIPVKTFLYKDQTDGELNLGVMAQDVDAVAPELVDRSGFGTAPEGESPYLAVYQTDLQYALMKCIQEQQALIAALTTRLDAANL